MNKRISLVSLFCFLVAVMLLSPILSVSAEDETGTTVERTIPKADYRKSIAIFFFRNESGTDEDWVGWWLPHGIYLDLVQDYYFDNRDPFQLSRALADAVGSLDAITLALMQATARTSSLTHFLEGSVLQIDPYEVVIRLYQTAGGRLLVSHTYQGGSLGDIIDQISVDLKREMGLGNAQITQAQDLPVEALTSSSEEALESYTRGLVQVYYESNWINSMPYFEATTGLISGNSASPSSV